MRFEEIIRNERTEGFIEGFAEVVADPSFEKECQMLTDRVLHKLMANYYTTSISRILEIRPDVMHKIAIITRLQPTDLIEHIDKYVAEVCAEGHEIGLVDDRKVGEWKRLITQVCRKLMKGENITAISDMLEETPETISMIVHVVEQHPDNMMDHINEYVTEVLKTITGAQDTLPAIQ